MFIIDGLVELEEELTPWFMDQKKFENYITKSTDFANYSLTDYELIIHENLEKSFYTIDNKLTYKEITKERNPIGINRNFVNIDYIKKLKNKPIGNISKPQVILLPKSNKEIQLSKNLMLLGYHSLKPINQKLEWANDKSDDLLSYISIRYHPEINKSGFDIGINFVINNIHETEAIANQIHNIMGGDRSDMHIFTKQFINYINNGKDDYHSKKSFTMYVKSFDVVNNLFFICKKNDLCITKVNFYHNAETNDFSKYIREYSEI